MHTQLIAQLCSALPPDRVVHDPAELFVYESDGFTIAHNRPAAVVFPITTEEVVAVVKVLIANDAAIIQEVPARGWRAAALRTTMAS